MAEYINKEYTINKIKSLNLDVAAGNTLYAHAFGILHDAVIKFVENIAPADVTERKSGQWVKTKDYFGETYECSECHAFVREAKQYDLIDRAFMYKYCPYCGAYMM